MSHLCETYVLVVQTGQTCAARVRNARCPPPTRTHTHTSWRAEHTKRRRARRAMSLGMRRTNCVRSASVARASMSQRVNACGVLPYVWGARRITASAGPERVGGGGVAAVSSKPVVDPAHAHTMLISKR